MRNVFKYSLIIPIFVGSIIFFMDTKNTDAQANCQITSVTFRTSKTVDNNFYEEAVPPYIYIDVVSSGCVGQSPEFSITELDDNDGLNNIDDDDIDLMDNRPINIVANQMTIALIAGEDECEQQVGQLNDCRYYLRVNNDIPNNLNDFNQLAAIDGTISYDCKLACDDDWQYIGVLDNNNTTTFNTHTNDPHDQYTGGSTPTDGGTGGVTPDDDDIAGGAGGTVIDLELENPLEGTIDTIPLLFEKVVDIFIKIGIPLVAIAILYSGFLFVTARGNENQIKTARQAFTFAIVGGLILLASWLVADAIRDALLTIN